MVVFRNAQWNCFSGGRCLTVVEAALYFVLDSSPLIRRLIVLFQSFITSV